MIIFSAVDLRSSKSDYVSNGDIALNSKIRIHILKARSLSEFINISLPAIEENTFLLNTFLLLVFPNFVNATSRQNIFLADSNLINSSYCVIRFLLDISGP